MTKRSHDGVMKGGSLWSDLGSEKFWTAAGHKNFWTGETDDRDLRRQLLDEQEAKDDAETPTTLENVGWKVSRAKKRSERSDSMARTPTLGKTLGFAGSLAYGAATGDPSMALGQTAYYLDPNGNGGPNAAPTAMGTAAQVGTMLAYRGLTSGLMGRRARAPTNFVGQSPGASVATQTGGPSPFVGQSERMIGPQRNPAPQQVGMSVLEPGHIRDPVPYRRPRVPGTVPGGTDPAVREMRRRKFEPGYGKWSLQDASMQAYVKGRAGKSIEPDWKEQKAVAADWVRRYPKEKQIEHGKTNNLLQLSGLPERRATTQHIIPSVSSIPPPPASVRKRVKASPEDRAFDAFARERGVEMKTMGEHKSIREKAADTSFAQARANKAVDEIKEAQTTKRVSRRKAQDAADRTVREVKMKAPKVAVTPGGPPRGRSPASTARHQRRLLSNARQNYAADSSANAASISDVAEPEGVWDRVTRLLKQPRTRSRSRGHARERVPYNAIGNSNL